MALKHRQSRREWEHFERMKAMEMGLRSPGGEVSGAAKSIAWIGAGVPIFSVFTALLTCIDGPESVDGVPLAAIAWGSASLISGGALVTSLVMAFMIGRPSKPVDSSYGFGHHKPVYDPDEFDVVASRG
jgi:formate hydrogenlyase subunit 3/multisubunit Na+/H+ antiporter MnhD subunit